MSKRKLTDYHEDAGVEDLPIQREEPHIQIPEKQAELHLGPRPAKDNLSGPIVSRSVSERISRLLHSLEEVLDPSISDEVIELLDDESVERCRRLQASLRRKQQKSSHQVETLAHDSRSSSPEATGSVLNHHQPVVLPSQVTPWNSASIPTSLPPLPAVLDPSLERAAFSHSGLVKHLEQSYERLEWIGDAYIYLISVLLISKTFTKFSPGQCSGVREKLVRNDTLASYFRQYGFESRARLPPEYNQTTPRRPGAMRPADLTKAQGDIFEAYVAAVILSDPQDGVNRVISWLKDLFSMTIAHNLRHYEKETAMIDGTNEEEKTLNSKVILSRRLVLSGVRLHYRDIAPERKDKETGKPIYTVGVFLEGYGETNKQLGFGSAFSKKDAGTKAASMALANKKLLKPFEAMKQMHLEKARKEAENK